MLHEKAWIALASGRVPPPPASQTKISRRSDVQNPWVLPAHKTVLISRGGPCGRPGAGTRPAPTSWPPAQDRLARRRGPVQARHAGGMRRLANQLRVLFGLRGNRAHGFDERIQFRFACAFGWLDHHRAGYDQWKRSGVRVESVIHEPLGYVAGADAFGGLAAVRKYALVQRRRIIGQLVEVLQPGAYVIGV